MSSSNEERIITRYLPFIERYFQPRVLNTEDMEDLCQEAAYQAVRSWKTFQNRSSISTWLYAICRNVLSAYIRKSGRLRLPDENRECESGGFEERVVLGLALENLEAKYRMLFELYYRLDYSVREIADLQRRPEGTVKYDLYVLRRKAQALMTDDNGG